MLTSFCRNISSIIVFQGLPNFQAALCRLRIQVKWLAQRCDGETQEEGVHHGHESHHLPPR